MNKLLVIGGVIMFAFILVIVQANKSDESKLKDNPYGTDMLSKSTIALLGNKNYSNIVLPDTLSKKIQSGDAVTAYFFHPVCHHCLEMTPVMMPIAKEMNVDVLQLNVLEFKDQVELYEIESWPVLIHYEDGKELRRMVNSQPEDKIREFFNEYDRN